MAGTSIIFPDANPAQADVIATLWTPEGIANLLTDEFVMGGTLAASIVNRAKPEAATAPVGAPQITARSIIVPAPASVGIDTKSIATELDQTFVIVCKGNASGGIFAAAGPFNGIMAGVNGNPWAFYNAQGGVAPDIAVTAYVGAGYQAVFGWGSQGDVGRICTGQNGALNPTNVGGAAGAARPSTSVKIGGGVYGGAFELAYAARVPAILTDAQRLAWYKALRGDGTAAGSPLGIVVL